MTETKATNGWLGGEDQNAGSRQRETRWLTPRKLVEPLGTFDLDPCGAPGWELAATTYLLEDGRDGVGCGYGPAAVCPLVHASHCGVVGSRRMAAEASASFGARLATPPDCSESWQWP